MAQAASRTGRLFLLMDALRSHRRPVTAARLAEDMSVSVRTIYRDMQTLIELGAPIEGEAGLGYLLRSGFFLPPLMFSEDELEALVLGARWVQRQGDDGLTQAAANALSKIATASPADLRDSMANMGLWPASYQPEPAGQSPSPNRTLGPIREAIRRQHKISISYRDEHGSATERLIWPIAIAFFEGKRLVIGWCELRSGFRHFRNDRISVLTVTKIRYPQQRSMLLQAWRRENSFAQDQ
ncbi:Predicted DNA-binding transcriptional regulator YafY, contains an HTH and WYL domains [Collimonas sp. OK242]|uniref:helix-turn-helix transcriptional regulator n=1 Tax=Collimonas sp. OK242 TaxID=1798195 RepID=UPI00089A0E87|nr:YafY family protein [Collimonas sp. OK242]SDY48880.1 Predicted DNA-binding transcriptional regulator YafY, contains an HTH and WYL domains [Collimonas sp. OK242]